MTLRTRQLLTQPECGLPTGLPRNFRRSFDPLVGRSQMPHSASLPTASAFQPDVVLASDEQLEPSLPLGSDGVRRWAWHSRHGAMLIEVIGDEAFVNGQRVEPYAP